MHTAEHLHPFRFAHHLPFASKIILNPGISFAASALLASIATVFSIHYALSVLVVWTAIFAFYLDRGLLERVLIPPFAIIILWEAMSVGLGVSLVIYGSGGKYDPYMFRMQATHLIMFPVMCAAYRFGFGKPVRMTFPDYSPSFEKQVVRPLVILGWGLFIWRVFQLTVFSATGAEDRGDFGLVATDQYFGIWTYFNLFPRLNTLGFFLVPLIYTRASAPFRMLLLATLGYYFMLAFATGARGNVFFPILYIGIGAFFFRILKIIKLDLMAVVVAICIFPLLILMDHFRNTDAYRASRTIDLGSRLGAVSEARTRSEENSKSAEGNENMLILGRALIGVMDATVYEMTPSVIPHAGQQNFSGIAYTWVPFFLFRDRPILYDANSILIDYTGGTYTRTGKAITLSADLYRRFGWLGVPIGLTTAFAFYGFCARMVYKVYLTQDALLGIVLILFLFSCFQSRPFSTVLTTWWIFFYETPKHLVILYALYIAAKRTCHLGKIPGAIIFAQGFHPSIPNPNRLLVHKTKLLAKPC